MKARVHRVAGGTREVWSLGVKAQPTTPAVGFVHRGSPAEFDRLLAAFRCGLKKVAMACHNAALYR
jgi:hypothetical protein